MRRSSIKINKKDRTSSAKDGQVIERGKWRRMVMKISGANEIEEEEEEEEEEIVLIFTFSLTHSTSSHACPF